MFLWLLPSKGGRKHGDPDYLACAQSGRVWVTLRECPQFVAAEQRHCWRVYPSPRPPLQQQGLAFTPCSVMTSEELVVQTWRLSLSAGPRPGGGEGLQVCGQDAWQCQEGSLGSLQRVVTTAPPSWRGAVAGHPEHLAVSRPRPQPRKQGSLWCQLGRRAV